MRQGVRPPAVAMRVWRNVESDAERRSQVGVSEVVMRVREAETQAIGMGSLRRVGGRRKVCVL